MLVGVDTTLAGAQAERVARLEAELVEQAKWREHPNRDMADDPGSWRTVPDPLKMRS